MSKQIFRLVHDTARQRALQAVRDAQPGQYVIIKDSDRSLAQNAKLHAIFEDFAKSGFQINGETFSADDWKILLISAHSEATKEASRPVIGLEGELVMLRESSAAMSVARMSSLIEYCVAFASQNNIKLSE